MFVANQQIFDVTEPEAEPADIFGNQLGACFRATVNQNMAIFARDENRGNAAGANEIGVRVDPNRRRRLVPIGRISANLGPQGSGLLDWGLGTLYLARGLAQREGQLSRGSSRKQDRCEGQSSEHS